MFQTLIQYRFYSWKVLFCVSKPSRSATKGPGGKVVLPTRFMVAIKLYLYKCLCFVCKCHVGLFLGLSLSRYKHGKLPCITWTFSSFPNLLPFSFFFRLWHFRHSNLDDHRGLELSPLFFSSFFLPSSPPLLFLLPSTNRDDSPRWYPDAQGAQQLIAVMALRAPSQTIRMLTSPPLNVHGSE